MFETGQPAERTGAASRAAPVIALNINFLPERHRGRRLRFAPLRPWLMLLSFALLLIPSWRLYRAQAARFRQVESELAAVSTALEGYQPLADERSRLERRIAQAEAELAEIEDAYDIVDIQLQSWSVLLPQILAAAPKGVEVTSLSQSGLEITIEGLAQSETLPAGYLDRLEALQAFAGVTIQQVTRIVLQEQAELEPTASANETAESEAADEGSASDAQPAIFSFEIRLELPAPEPAVHNE